MKKTLCINPFCLFIVSMELKLVCCLWTGGLPLLVWIRTCCHGEKVIWKDEKFTT